MPSPIGHIGNQTFWSTFHGGQTNEFPNGLNQEPCMEAGTLPKNDKIRNITNKLGLSCAKLSTASASYKLVNEGPAGEARSQSVS